MVDNTLWGVYFDDGRMLTISNSDIEGNGTSGNNATGGLYVGVNTGKESGEGFVSTAVSVEECWFEANSGISAVQFNSGVNYIYKSYFVANHNSTYDVHMVNGRYKLSDVHCDLGKTNNFFEESTILSGNSIENCDYFNATYNTSKTYVRMTNGRTLARSGEVPVVYYNTSPLIQFGATGTAGATVNVIFDTPFSSAPKVFTQIFNDSNLTLECVEIFNVTTTGFTLRRKMINNGSTTIGTSNAWVNWIAIGSK
jgi:hypothetical protein